ncbi:MAG TPA: hypothetical protein VMG10_20955 [Gemmataceae bacterium]|nr:hypothetical protein [Gemmataceae bacterium]
MKYSLLHRVDAEGVLHFGLELGEEYANKFVRVTVEGVGPASGDAPLSDEEWSKRVKDLAGKWLGEFERPPQGEYEQREELS